MVIVYGILEATEKALLGLRKTYEEGQDGYIGLEDVAEETCIERLLYV